MAGEKTAEEKLDAVLSHMDSLHKAHADTNKRLDAMEEERKADRAKLDAACSKMDAAEEDKKKADKARADAEEKAKADAAEKEKEEKAKADAARKDAEEKEAKEKEEKAKADAAARATDPELKARLAAIEKSLPPVLTSEDRQRFVTAQFKAEPVYQAFGDSAGAPAFLNGESLPDYQRRLLGKVKQHSPKWKDKDLSKIDASVLDIAEEQIYADAMQAALHPTDLPVGVLREIKKVDEANRVVRHFVSNDEAACWRQFGTPGGARLGCINANVGKAH